MDTDGRRPDRIGFRTRPVSTRGHGNQLGQIRGREERPIYKNGARTKSGRYRREQLGPGKRRQGNGKTICNRFAIVDDGNHQRPEPA